ncbi:hypothetical protein Tco_0824708 [Tanacetum coccineum]|uniref:Uncharacterized protein n=1 Tax=Tanacetum coccineum TaxID=301880 RepID=A0ABQ5AR65_9ASTR
MKTDEDLALDHVLTNRSSWDCQRGLSFSWENSVGERVVLPACEKEGKGRRSTVNLTKYYFIDLVPKCMAWLDYDEHVDSLSTMDNEVGVTSPKITTQTLPSFEEYILPVTYPEEVEKTLWSPIEVEPLNETKLEEVDLNCNHNTPLSSREVPSFDGLEPQPLPNSLSLDVSLGDVIGPEPPIKPHSLDSSRMRIVDYLTTQTPPSPHVENSRPKEMFDDDWGLESKEVSPLGEELSLFDRPNEVERGRILEAHRLESIIQQRIF